MHMRGFGTALTIAAMLSGQAAEPHRTVTAVEGESWSNHIHRTFNETSMGKTGDLGPAPPVPGDPASSWRLELSPNFAAPAVTLQGADLYRLNCRGCHGELGHGAPPEINSVIGPVQATSVTATTQKMKAAGRDINPADLVQVARESKTLLLQRLHVGGQHMPPPTLTEPEIRTLLPYLQQLSDVPGAGNNRVTVKISRSRLAATLSGKMFRQAASLVRALNHET